MTDAIVLGFDPNGEAAFGVAICLDRAQRLERSAAYVKRWTGLRHGARALYRIFTHALFSASSTALISTAVELVMNVAHDRIATALAGTAGEALAVARRMYTLGLLTKGEIRPLPPS
jgi:hypothetical protein